MQGGEIEIYGDGQQSRCFLHVHDCVRALQALAASPDAVGQVFNIGATSPMTIAELAEAVVQQVHRRVGATPVSTRYVPYEVAYGPGFEDMRRRVPSIDKIGRITGWAPTLTLEHIIDDVVDDLLVNEPLVDLRTGEQVA